MATRPLFLLSVLLCACGVEPCPEGSSRQADDLCHQDAQDDGSGDDGGSGDDAGSGDEGGTDDTGGSGGDSGGDSGGETGGDTGDTEGDCPDTPFEGDVDGLDYADYPVYIDGGDRRFTSLQDAIWGAEEGDRVVACPGTYFEVVDFKGKVITLTSAEGPAHTTIDARGEGPGVRLRNYEPAETVLEGFHITGGAGEEWHGGGIWVEWGSPTIRYNVVEGNSAGIGGGIYVRNGGANVHNNLVVRNHAEEGGGGIVCTACVGSVRYNTFVENTADRFGPFSEWYWGIADLEGNIVVQEAGETKPALYYREHRGEDFSTTPNLVWPEGDALEGMAEADWPSDDWLREDPAFVDPESFDFQLSSGSPAVDAGPDGESDADGSAADLGAFGGPDGAWPWAISLD